MASSPTISGWDLSFTNWGIFDDDLYPDETIPILKPLAERWFANQIQNGVLPDPPTVWFPTIMIGVLKLYVFNKIVAEKKGQTDFYLTNSPFCSSRVEPNMTELDNWAFGGLFPVDKKITTEATTINDILSQLKLDYIDWFKTDSQGTDMRIFTAIDQPIIDKIVVAEFEPGIINAYKQEDLLYSIIEYMRTFNAIGMILFILYIFKAYLNLSNPVTKVLARASFPAYVVQLLFVFPLIYYISAYLTWNPLFIVLVEWIIATICAFVLGIILYRLPIFRRIF